MLNRVLLFLDPTWISFIFFWSSLKKHVNCCCSWLDKLGKLLTFSLVAHGNWRWNFLLQLVEVLLVFALFCSSPWTVWSSNTLCQQTNEEVRPHSVSITEFGAVGDGVTLNTKAFQNAIFYLNSFADKGGAKLFVPAGRWLTGSFDLISHLTLSLDKDAIILGSMVCHSL